MLLVAERADGLVKRRVAARVVGATASGPEFSAAKPGLAVDKKTMRVALGQLLRDGSRTPLQLLTKVVPAQRTVANFGPAIVIAQHRSADSQAGGLSGLLARHDVLWIPGSPRERTDLARDPVDPLGRGGQGDDPVTQWLGAKAAASDAMIDAGATITHHHAVGTDHKPWLAREIGPLGVSILRAVKADLDPTGILNPGVLIP